MAQVLRLLPPFDRLGVRPQADQLLLADVEDLLNRDDL